MGKFLLPTTNNYIIALTNLRDKVMGRGYSPHHNNSSLTVGLKVANKESKLASAERSEE